MIVIINGVRYAPVDDPKPKGYNGMVVCYEYNGYGNFFTVGKMYEYVDGLVCDDTGAQYNMEKPSATKNEALNRNYVKFVEYVE